MNPFYQAIIENNTIGAIEDPCTGALYILIDGKEFYCSPNWEGTENDIAFQYVNDEDDFMFWDRRVIFTGDLQEDVQKWQSAVQEEIAKLSNN